MSTKRKIEDFEIEHGSLGKSRNDGTDEHSSRLTDVRDVESISTRSRSPILPPILLDGSFFIARFASPLRKHDKI